MKQIKSRGGRTVAVARSVEQLWRCSEGGTLVRDGSGEGGHSGGGNPPNLRLMRYTASDTLSAAPVMLMVRSVLPHSRSFSSQLLMRMVAPLICLRTDREAPVT